MITNNQVYQLYLEISKKSVSEIHNVFVSQFPELSCFEKPQFLYMRVMRVYRNITNMKKNKHPYLNEFLVQPFTCPARGMSDVPSERGDADSNSIPLTQKLDVSRKQNKALKRKLSSLEYSYQILVNEQVKYQAAVEQIGEVSHNFDKLLGDCTSIKDRDIGELKSNLQTLRVKYEEQSMELDNKVSRIQDLKSKSFGYRVQNHGLHKKIARRDNLISDLQCLKIDKDKTLSELESAKSTVKKLEIELSDKMEALQVSKFSNSSLKRSLSYYKRKLYDVTDDTHTDKIVLEDKVQDLKKSNYDLQQLVDLLDDPVIMTFQDGRYTDEIREVVMKLLSLNVSMSKISSVITVVLSKLANKAVERLPCIASTSRFVSEANCLSKMQVIESMIEDPESMKGVCLHTDGTSKFHKHYQNYQVTLLDGRTMSIGLHEMAYADADHIVESFKDLVSELDEVTRISSDVSDESDASNLRVAEIVASIKNTITDQGAVNPCFNRQLKVLREQLLPKVVDNWDNLNSEIKSEIAEMGNFFCKMHLLVNFATEADKTLNIFENVATDSESTKSASIIQTNESGPARLVRTAVKALHHRGSEEAGVASYFNSFLQSRGKKSKLISYKGNRFNVLFYDAAAVYYHHDDIIEFISSWHQPNRLLVAVNEDLNNKINIAGIRALGIIDKIITGPYWRMLNKNKGILEAGQYLLQMQHQFEKWAEDATSLLQGELLFSDDKELAVHKDELFHALFAVTDDSELDCLTQQSLELLCRALLILLERQAVDQLPGGKYWNPSLSLQQQAANVPKTNVASERDFAILDMLVRMKPSGTILLFETLTLWMNNKTLKWLDGKSDKERAELMNNARKNAPIARKKFKERNEKISKQKIEHLLLKQQKKEEVELKSQSKTADLTNKMSCTGGVWLTVSDVDYQTSKLSETAAREAMVSQLNFRRHVMKCKGDKGLFFQSITCDKKRIPHTNEQLLLNLKTVIELNPHIQEELPSSGSDLVKVREFSERQILFEEEKIKLVSKLQAAREKRAIKAQIESLPLYLENPELMVGREIKHKCRSEGGVDSSWYDGEVIEIIRFVKDLPLKTEYSVAYKDDSDETWRFPLLMDLKNGDLIIV